MLLLFEIFAILCTLF